MAGNILDRAIGWIAPEAGARRLRARVAAQVLARGYDATSRDRTKHSWYSPSSSADAEIARAGALLRDRMRDLVRNNPYAANAVSVLVTHAVGDGIRPRTKDPRVNVLFEEWSRQADADGQLDFYGLQSLVAREMIESGDGLVRRRMRLASDGLTVPMQLQVIEIDHLDGSKDGAIDGGLAVQGIQHDGIGRRRGYWLYPYHPGGAPVTMTGGITSRFVPADQIAHVFEKQRTQVRGAPWGAPVMSSLRALAQFEEAELIRKKIEACMVGIMTGGDFDDQVGLQLTDEAGRLLPPGLYNAAHERIEKFEPGMIYNAVGGRDIKFTQPASAGGYDTYKTSMLHTIAAGFRVPHALLTGRLDRVNYSSSKIGLESFKRTISAMQWQIIIPMFCEPVWRWFLQAALVAGKIDHLDHPAEWSPPRFYSADPVREISARIAEVRAGFKSLPEAISETGYNPDDVLAQIAGSNAKLDELGIVVDSDPRRMSQAGQTQQKPPDDEEDNDDE